MKVPVLLTLGLCFSIAIPALAQPAGAQQQQQNQKQTQQRNKDRARERTHEQTQPRVQQQQRTQQQTQPRVQQQQRTQQQTQPRVQQQQRTQQQTQPRVQQQQRTQQQTQPRVQQQQRTQQQPRTYNRPQVQQRQQSQQQMRQQTRERFRAPNAPPRETTRNFQPRYYRSSDGRIDRRPMYRNGVWYGRSAPNDARFRLSRPFARGHFYRYGPSYYHRIVRFNRANYWFWLSSGYYFQIAYWDWPYCSDWCWDCGDQFLIYLDPDHPGWYLVLNVQTGVYVHATYMGM